MNIDVIDLGFSYKTKQSVFNHVGFSLHEGQILSILGANGAGKSTLLNCIAGLLRPQQGDVLLNGKSVFSRSRREVARLLGYVPQIHDATFSFTVLEYVVMGRAPYLEAHQSPSSVDYDIATRNIEKMGLSGCEEKLFSEMSGGEQQLATIARVLTQQPELILMDEPTNHLDYGNQFRAIDAIESLANDGYAVITTTHNPDHAFMLGGQVAILNSQGGLRIGKTEDVLNEEALSALYRMGIGITACADAGYSLCYAKRRENVSLRNCC